MKSATKPIRHYPVPTSP